jgi:hypothetical protein
MAWQPGETVLGLYEVKDVRSGGMGWCTGCATSAGRWTWP